MEKPLSRAGFAVPCRRGAGAACAAGDFYECIGKCLAELARFYKLPPEAFIVIYDDIDLSVGSLRVRANGSAGTHNGMRSIVEELGTQSFARVRIGIGRPPQKMDLAD